MGKKLGLTALAILGVLVVYAAVHLALIEIGQEIAILHQPLEDGSLRPTRLWIVDEGELAWLHHGMAPRWLSHIEDAPFVEVEREGKRTRYRAIADPSADPQVHDLLRAKYGAADRLVRFWYGTDTERGFATRSTCTALPVRLERLGP